MKPKRTPRLTRHDIACLIAARRLMEDQPGQGWTIPQLARKVTLNEDKLKWGFRLLFAQTVHTCLVTARMKRAALLLVQTDHPVKAVAFHVGYPTRSFFRVFQKHYGCTPDIFRKQGQ